MARQPRSKKTLVREPLNKPELLEKGFLTVLYFI
jgi:hypothetical protein